jgi:hypothetical protein
VVQRAAGDHQQRKTAFEGDLGPGVDGAVAAADPEHGRPVRGVAERLAQILPGLDDLRLRQLVVEQARDVTAARVAVDHHDDTGAIG